MAAATAVSMTMSPIQASQKWPPAAHAFFKPLTLRTTREATTGARAARRFKVRAFMKAKAVAGLTVVVLTASMVVPDVAEAASGVSPSLNNFLLSIAAGGVVAPAIVGAVIGVSNFDPVKRS